MNQTTNLTPGVLCIGVRNRGGSIGMAAAGLARVVAVCDVDRASSDKFLAALAKRQTARPEVYKDYRQALERQDVDVVTIGTPDHWHTAILIAALRAGKDVYCEKPLTLTIDEGKRICRVVRETGRIVQVGTQQRTEFKRMFLKAVAIARSGRLGQAPKVPYTEKRCHGTFRWWLEYSGGKMTDWGAHHVDIAQWALGAENTGPVEIEGLGEVPLGGRNMVAMLTGRQPAVQLPNSYNTPTTFRVVLRYANGNTLIVQDAPGNGIDIEGEKGRLFVSRSRLVGLPVAEIAASERDTAWLDKEVVRLYGGREPGTHMQNFIESVRERRQPVSDVFTHHRSVSACHLANLALLVGRKLRWDPEKEDFGGDREANALLSREQRKPYTIEG